MRLHHFAINVTDLDRSIRFYCEALGYEEVGRFALEGQDMEFAMRLPAGSKGASAYLKGNSNVQLELIQWDGPDNDAPPAPGSRGYLLLAYWVDAPEVADVHARVRASGGSCQSEPRRISIAGSDILAFVAEDPDGNLIEIIGLRPQ